MTGRYGVSSEPLSMSAALDRLNLDGLSRAHEAARSMTECPGCKSGEVPVDVDGQRYFVPCALLDADCRHGTTLTERMGTYSLSAVMAIPGLPGRFRADLRAPKPTAAISGASAWLGSGKTFLALYGRHGTGKSLAAAHVLYQMVYRANKERWQTPALWTPLSATWLSAYRLTSKDEAFDGAQTAPVLVIDDLGGEMATQFARARIAETISERYNQQRLTVLTTNDDVIELSKIYGNRMADRVLGDGLTVCSGSGESMRLVS